jgi:hypothetical protein
MDNLQINVENGVKTLTVLQGSSLPLKEPLKVNIKGNINSVLEYLEKRKIDELNSHIIVDINNMSITLYVDEKNFYLDIIQGTLMLSKIFQVFEINTGVERSTFQLADFVKMNRSYFQTSTDALKLISELNNFKAKVLKEIEKSDDKRANTTELKRQVVESNIPKSFILNIPLFSGMERRNIEVEVYINSDTLNCSLISPHANEIIQNESELILDKIIGSIKELCPNLVIIYV